VIEQEIAGNTVKRHELDIHWNYTLEMKYDNNIRETILNYAI